jgi:hypothetical protein
MGTEFMSGFDGFICEHETTILIVGDINTVRSSLIKALEKMEYSVIEEQPLYAKRDARNGGKNSISTNILDYTTKLHIGLKSSGDNSVVASFNYNVKHPYTGEADRQTLSREAEAICALARVADRPANCSVCGLEFTSDSRFCRKCGSPLKAAEPAELEVLRLTARALAAYESVRFGLLFVVLSLLCFIIPLIPGLILKPKLLTALHVMGLILASSCLLLANGWRHLRNFFKPGKERERLESRGQISLSQKTGPLYIQEAPPSVTERTTNLLDKSRNRERVPIRRETN